jgi:HD-GYP domain-containing protein (c-di-GMP phosphodiesterase class II)/DNA-binding CsgD family transcriptional regulator
VREPRIRLAELIASLSFAADLGMGYPMEQMLRASLVATRLAEHMRLPREVISEAYYIALLRHVGCTFGSWFLNVFAGGDDIAFRRRAAVVDFLDHADVGTLFAYVATLPGAKPDPSELPDSSEIWVGECEMGMSLAARLGLAPGVQRGMHLLWERWDGRGPRGVRGDDLPLSLRVARVALFGVESSALIGMDATLAALKRRAGGWFDPSIAEAFAREASTLLGGLPAAAWNDVLDAEPEPRLWLLEPDLDRAARAIADMADLRAPFLHGHSAGVGALAEQAARQLGFRDGELAQIRRAANMHDIGRHGVPTGVWETPGRLSEGAWERVRLHPYYTERILSRSPAFAALGALAGMHHERCDGSGYHRGAVSGSLPMAARVIAAADAFEAMTEERPHRPARAPAEAAQEVLADVRAGHLDPDAGLAVCEAGGQVALQIRRAWPAGLSDREVEVLRLVARGRSKREVADALTVSVNTVDTHVRHVYDKIGVSTRAGAAIFAMEHDILRPEAPIT